MKHNGWYLLKHYNFIAEIIDSRRKELLTPYTIQDTNIGGGKSNTVSSPVEDTVFTLVEDEELVHMERIKRVIERAVFFHYDIDVTVSEIERQLND